MGGSVELVVSALGRPSGCGCGGSGRYIVALSTFLSVVVPVPAVASMFPRNLLRTYVGCTLGGKRF